MSDLILIHRQIKQTKLTCLNIFYSLSYILLIQIHLNMYC